MVGEEINRNSIKLIKEEEDKRPREMKKIKIEGKKMKDSRERENLPKISHS